MGCEDKAMVNIYDKDAVSNGIGCLKYNPLIQDKLISQTLKRLYTFSDECKYRLEVSKKSDIVCNSNQNSDKKALSNFPSSYLKMDVTKNNKTIYSYYIDLNDRVNENDVKNGFKRVLKDLSL